MNILQTEINYVPGVGPKRAEILNKEADIFTLGDLLRWYPYRYIDRRRIYYIHEIDQSQAYIQLKERLNLSKHLVKADGGDWWHTLPTARVLWIWSGFAASVL